MLTASNLTGKYWTGSTWIYDSPTKALDKDALISSSITGIDCDAGIGDVVFIDGPASSYGAASSNDAKTHTGHVLVAQDTGSVEHLSLKYSEQDPETKGPSFYYWERTGAAAVSEQDDVITSLSRNADGRVVLASSLDGSVAAIDRITFGVTRCYRVAHSNGVLSVGGNPMNADVFVSSGKDGYVATWDLRDTKCASGELATSP